jgi:hypothetical protein
MFIGLDLNAASCSSVFLSDSVIQAYNITQKGMNLRVASSTDGIAMRYKIHSSTFVLLIGCNNK